MATGYDIFLSYHWRDNEAVESVAHARNSAEQQAKEHWKKSTELFRLARDAGGRRLIQMQSEEFLDKLSRITRQVEAAKHGRLPWNDLFF